MPKLSGGFLRSSFNALPIHVSTTHNEQLVLHTVEADRYRMEAARFDHQDLTSAIDLAVKTQLYLSVRAPRSNGFVYHRRTNEDFERGATQGMDYFWNMIICLMVSAGGLAAKRSPTKTSP